MNRNALQNGRHIDTRPYACYGGRFDAHFSRGDRAVGYGSADSMSVGGQVFGNVTNSQKVWAQDSLRFCSTSKRYKGFMKMGIKLAGWNGPDNVTKKGGPDISGPPQQIFIHQIAGVNVSLA